MELENFHLDIQSQYIYNQICLFFFLELSSSEFTCISGAILLYIEKHSNY